MKTFWFDLLSLHQPRTAFPEGCGEAALLAFLRSIRIDGAPAEEFAGYLERDWRRFLYTWSLCRDLRGKCLEIGASPYFTTAMLMEFTALDLVGSNLAAGEAKVDEHRVHWRSPGADAEALRVMRTDLFNIEGDRLPYPDGHFDVVLFCEVLEHLTHDPLAALLEIRRVLKPGGRLILTTPNAACLRNVLKMLRGQNVGDRYSAYGPYGRHNREYTLGEVVKLLDAVGFTTQRSFTANVLFRRMPHLVSNFVGELLFTLFSRKRARKLGQYSFISAVKADLAAVRRPDWLYRSYADMTVVPASPERAEAA